jgi:phosphatidylinositol glycan class O
MGSVFATGHQATFSAIQFQTGFIGLSGFDFYLSGALVATNSIGMFIVFTAAQSVILGTIKTSALRSEVMLAQGLYPTLSTLVSATTAAFLRRHLMVWNVFAPRFMLAALQVLVILTTILYIKQLR